MVLRDLDFGSRRHLYFYPRKDRNYEYKLGRGNHYRVNSVYESGTKLGEMVRDKDGQSHVKGEPFRIWNQ